MDGVKRKAWEDRLVIRCAGSRQQGEETRAAFVSMGREVLPARPCFDGFAYCPHCGREVRKNATGMMRVHHTSPRSKTIRGAA